MVKLVRPLRQYPSSSSISSTLKAVSLKLLRVMALFLLSEVSVTHLLGGLGSMKYPPKQKGGLGALSWKFVKI